MTQSSKPLAHYEEHDMVLCVAQVKSQCKEILSCPVVMNILSEGLYAFIREEWIKH